MNSQPLCKREGCGLLVDEANLCFAHKSSYLIEVVADVMRAKKIISASTGGVTVHLYPAAFLEETIAPGGAAGVSEPVVPDETNEPGLGLRELMGEDH